MRRFCWPSFSTFISARVLGHHYLVHAMAVQHPSHESVALSAPALVHGIQAQVQLEWWEFTTQFPCLPRSCESTNCSCSCQYDERTLALITIDTVHEREAQAFSPDEERRRPSDNSYSNTWEMAHQVNPMCIYITAASHHVPS